MMVIVFNSNSIESEGHLDVAFLRINVEINTIYLLFKWNMFVEWLPN